MNVTARTLPRRSVSDSRSPACVVSAKFGALPTTGKRSLSFVPCAAAGGKHAPRSATRTERLLGLSHFTPSIPHRKSRTTDQLRLARTRGRSRLHLPLEPSHNAPIRTLRDDLLRRALDH